MNKKACAGSCIAVLLVFGIIVGFVVARFSSRIGSGNTLVGPLEARNGFHTKIKTVALDTENSSHTGNYPDEPPPNVFKFIHFDSPAGKLAAYITPDPQDGKKHPVIVWAHGGFGGIGDFLWKPDDQQDCGEFIRAGFIVMCPSWRGENDNPGRYEMFYGEVEDAVAAIDYVSKLSYVNPKRIYMGGHSTGGTITMLTTESTSKLRASFPFGGAPDMFSVVRFGADYGNTPYDRMDKEESRLRSPIEFTRAIKSPMWYFEGSDSSYASEAINMQNLAMKYNIPFYVNIVPGATHFSVLQPICRLIAQKIKNDSGSECNIQIRTPEIEDAFNGDTEQQGRR